LAVGKQHEQDVKMVSPETGEPLFRDIRPIEITYKGLSMTVDLPGYYPAGEGEAVHVGDDMAVVDSALRILKEKAGLPSPETIRNVRKKLNLSQREAGLLFKVGENAFDKYERGLIVPSGPTIQLMKVLDRHPELVEDLR
jgi:HTH-type transcriptional regulator / antitoxin MqsA